MGIRLSTNRLFDYVLSLFLDHTAVIDLFSHNALPSFHIKRIYLFLEKYPKRIFRKRERGSGKTKTHSPFFFLFSFCI
jgi:hypothetical protein